jgi:hypothetical protein
VADSERGGTLRAGEVLNNTYIIEELIGAGGTGEVYRARNRVSGREMAIKILRREYAASEAFIDLMRREASVLHEVVDDAVVRYHDLLESEAHGGFVFLVMEFIRGESLAELMKRGPVDEATLLLVGRRIAQGLRAAHGKLAFHRDLSPDNVILRDGDPARTVLIDFGIAKDVSADARTVIGSGFAGKYQYAAPEQMEGNVDGRSDLYSLGMTLIGAFRGRTPDVGASFLEVIRTKSLKPDISDMQGTLHALVDRLVEPNPADRFQSAGDVLAWFDGRAPGSPRQADATRREPRREETPARPEPPTRRGSPVRALVALLLIAALGGAGWYFGLGPGRAMLFPPTLEVASPYRLDIAVTASGAMTVSGNAPSPEAAAALMAALSALNRDRTPTGSLTIADGLPGPGWQPGAVAIARALSVLPAWRLSLTGTRVEIFGDTADKRTFDSILDAARAAAREGGLVFDNQSFVLVPPDLNLAMLRKEINAFATCGALEVLGGDGRTVPPGGTVTVGGAISRPDDRLFIENALKAPLGGRPLILQLSPINIPVCKVMGFLPPEPDPRLDFRFAFGNKPGEAENGVYHAGDNPVVTLSLPAGLDGFLHVFFVDVEGAIYHFLPHNNRQANRLSAIGTIEGGRRAVALLVPADEGTLEMLSMEVAEPFGINVIVAVVTKEPLFAELRPRAESVEAFLPDLGRALALHKDAALGYRFLVAEP